MLLRKTIWNLCTSAQPNSHDSELGLFSKDTVSRETVFGHMVGSWEEAVHQIVGDVELDALTFVHIIIELPERPASPVEHFVPFVYGFTSFVRMVHVECFEVVHVKVWWGKGFNIVKFLLFNLFDSLNGNLFLDYFFDCQHWLEWLGAHDLSSNDLHNGRVGIAGISPSGDVGHGFSESSIKDGLESIAKVLRDVNISDCHLVSNQPLLALKVCVQSLDVSLEVLEAGIVLLLL